MRRNILKRGKNVLTVSLVMSMTLLMCSCGNSGSYEIKSALSDDNAALSKSDDNTELTVWCWDPAFNISAMDTAADMYKKSHPDVTVNVEEVDAGDIIAQMSTAIKSGEYDKLPDVLLMKDTNLSENLDYYDGIFADLTDSGIDYSQFASYKADLGVYNNKNYTVPFDSGAAVMCLREDIIEEAGYTVDDFENITWSKFIQMGKVVKKKTGMPLLTSEADSSDFIMMLVQSGGEWLFKNGKPYIYNNKALRAAMQTYKQLVQTGVLKEVNNWNAYTGSINDGKAAGTMNGCWIVSTIAAQEDQSGKWRVTNIPKLNGVSGAVNYSNCGGSSWLVTETSSNKDVAIDFLKSTFGSSSEFYGDILPVSGALGTYLPAADSEAYQQKQDYFGGDAIYEQISEYASHVPSVEYGIYNASAYSQAAIHLMDYVNGDDINTVLRAYQRETEALYK